MIKFKKRIAGVHCSLTAGLAVLLFFSVGCHGVKSLRSTGKEERQKSNIIYYGIGEYDRSRFKEWKPSPEGRYGGIYRYEEGASTKTLHIIPYFSGREGTVADALAFNYSIIYVQSDDYFDRPQIQVLDSLSYDEATGTLKNSRISLEPVFLDEIDNHITTRFYGYIWNDLFFKGPHPSER